MPFVAGDAFDSNHLEPVSPFYSPPETPTPQLQTLTSLNPLRGHVSAIHASAFFHLFGEAEQFHLAKAIAGLLSPKPGSMILGAHGGLPVKGIRNENGVYQNPARTRPMFCHSPDSWKELWDGQIFEKGTIKVEAILHEHKRRDLGTTIPEGTKLYLLVWSVTRL